MHTKPRGLVIPLFIFSLTGIGPVKKETISGYTVIPFEEVELFHNGKTIGKQETVSYKKLIWDLIYKPGRLAARRYRKGKVVTKDVVETTTVPSQVTFTVIQIH
jgi:hypothetical protein